MCQLLIIVCVSIWSKRCCGGIEMNLLHDLFVESQDSRCSLLHQIEHLLCQKTPAAVLDLISTHVFLLICSRVRFSKKLIKNTPFRLPAHPPTHPLPSPQKEAI